MSKRMMNLFLGLLSLCIGFILYLLFRENTLISRLFAQMTALSHIRSYFEMFSCDFLKYYFPDFLWAFSLSCLLEALCARTVKGTVICCFTAIACGSIWEILQWLCILNGTGDCLDIIMYLFGGGLCLLINTKEKEV